MREVVVTEHARPAVTRQSAPLQQMDRQEIEQLGIQDLAEVVRRFSGVTVKDYGGIGGLKTVSVRSLGAQHTAVSYDGIPVGNAQSGDVDLSRFSLENVQAVSLAIGQSDHIFQPARSFALSGLLNIQTLRPRFEEKNMNLTAKVKGGSFWMFAPSIRYEQKLSDKLSATLHADWTSAQGEYPFTLTNVNVVTEERRKNSDIQSLRLEGNLYGDWANGSSMNGKVYLFKSNRGLPGSVTLYNPEATERMWDDIFFTQLHYQRPLSAKVSFQANGKYNYSFLEYIDRRDVYAQGFVRDVNTQQEVYGSVAVEYKPWEVFSLSASTDLTWNTLSNNYIAALFPKRLTSQSVVAAQYKTSRLTATGSLLGTFVMEEVATGNNPDDLKRLSPSVGLSWQPFASQGLRVRASFKDNFRIPTFTDLYYQRYGTARLKPEKARQYNVGLTWSGEIGSVVRYLALSVDGYYNKINDKIIAIPRMYLYQMMNLGEVDIKGLDVTMQAEIPLTQTIDLKLNGNYTYQQAINVTNPETTYYKDQIPYTPRHTGTASAIVETPWVDASYSLTAVGKRYWANQNIDRYKLDPYQEHSVSASREFRWKKCLLKLQVDAINLSNKTYEIVKYYPMPGRSWVASLTVIY